jgi:hypothetical protein
LRPRKNFRPRIFYFSLREFACLGGGVRGVFLDWKNSRFFETSKTSCRKFSLKAESQCSWFQHLELCSKGKTSCSERE